MRDQDITRRHLAVGLELGKKIQEPGIINYSGTMIKTIVITGGAGFIGSHVVRLFVRKYPEYRIVNLDLLTYAGNLENLTDIENKANYRFIKGDIADHDFINRVFHEFLPDGIIHLAAESHVDWSILDPLSFIRTNILGTVTLLDASRKAWQDNFANKCF